MSFAGLNILISGASAGIGAEFAGQLHTLGANLVLVARRTEILERMCRDFNNARSASAQFISADLCDARDLNRVTAFIKANRVDVLINNAGFGSFNYFDQLDVEHEIKMVQLNIVAYLRLTHAVLGQMKERRSGAILNVSSIAGFQPLPFMATYAGTKAFDLFHSLALSYELEEFGIKVLAVCPGPTATEFFGVARVPGTITGVGRDSVQLVVGRSLAALRADQKLVVTGFRSKLMAFGSRFFPLRLTTRLTARFLKPVAALAARK